MKGAFWVGYAQSSVPNTFYSVRFQFVSKNHIPLTGRAQSTYRDQILNDKRRCRLPWSLVAACTEINQALGSAKAFHKRMLQEHRQLFGSEGYNAGMQRALAAMAAVFDWPRLVGAPTTTHMVHEFGVLAAMVLPYLEHVDWHSVDEFPKVQFEWPPKNVLQYQSVRSAVSSTASGRGDADENLVCHRRSCSAARGNDAFCNLAYAEYFWPAGCGFGGVRVAP